MGNFTVGIIGCGNMGSAIVKGMVAKKVLSGDSIFLYDKDIQKSETLAGETGCALGELSQMVRGSDLLIIAVKPQDSEALFREIASDIVDQTIVSVMAGVSIEVITGRLGKKVPVVRAMPNMAAVVSEGVTCIARNDLVKRIEEVKSVFTGIGGVVEIEEKLMDAVTALSGSGPAYLFYLAGSMIEAAVDMGIDERKAEMLVKQTLYGASCLLQGSDETPEKLIKKVASKGGTTEAALGVFREDGLKEIIKTAIKKAGERSGELSKG
jgi:pyrroline-5-carboxylate reductase